MLGLQVCKSASLQVCKSASLQVCKSASLQACRSVGLQVCSLHVSHTEMASNRFYIRNADEVFEAELLSLLQQCRDCLHENSDGGGHAEFLARRLEEYQRTLRVMYGRVRELVQENQLTQDLERLMQVIGTRLQSLATLVQ